MLQRVPIPNIGKMRCGSKVCTSIIYSFAGSLHTSIKPSPSVCLSIRFSVYQYVCLPFHPSVYKFLCPSVWLYECADLSYYKRYKHQIWLEGSCKPCADKVFFKFHLQLLQILNLWLINDIFMSQCSASTYV